MEQPLKVMRVLVSLGRGGMEKVIVDEIKRFDREKVSLSVCCVGRKGEYARELEEDGIKVYLCTKETGGNRIPLPLKLARLFRDENVDIVHSYSGVYRDAALGALFSRVPAILHTDQGKFYPDRRWSRLNHWLFSHFRDKVIAVSNELRDFLVNEVNISPKKVMTIYNAVDVKDHAIKIDVQEKKRQLNISPEEKVIGIVARLVPVKDHRTLFAAFKKVRQACPKTKLLIVGEGPLDEDLRRYASELGETENILFLGKRDDVRELLHIMDVVCLASLSEGLSLTLLEAMASARPAVATNVGGNPELVLDGLTGLLVPPRDPERMAEAIVALLRDDGRRRSMGEAGRKRVEEKFNIQNCVKEYEELYFNLARQKGVIR